MVILERHVLGLRIMSLMVRLFRRLDYADRRWLLERLSADHRTLPR